MTNDTIKPIEPPSHEEITSPRFDGWQSSDDPHVGAQAYISSVVCPDHDCPDCHK